MENYASKEEVQTLQNQFTDMQSTLNKILEMLTNSTIPTNAPQIIINTTFTIPASIQTTPIPTASISIDLEVPMHQSIIVLTVSVPDVSISSHLSVSATIAPLFGNPSAITFPTVYSYVGADNFPVIAFAAIVAVQVITAAVFSRVGAAAGFAFMCFDFG